MKEANNKIDTLLFRQTQRELVTYIYNLLEGAEPNILILTVRY